MTEQSVTGRRGEGPLGIAEPVSRVMIGAVRNWSRSVLLWNLAADPQNGAAHKQRRVHRMFRGDHAGWRFCN
jgi:hypothetical protein